MKLEQKVLVTETGIELLSNFPFEEALLPGGALSERPFGARLQRCQVAGDLE